jgi:glycyl-tRNA synthetase beta subunit
MKLLIEIGTEELPAGVINLALESLKEGIEKLLGSKSYKNLRHTPASSHSDGRL